MNRPFFLSAALGLAAGLAVFLYQSAVLENLTAAAAGQSTIPAKSAAANPSAARSARVWDAPPVPAREQPSGRLLDRLAARMVDAFNARQLTEFLEPVENAEAGQLALLAGLSPAERDTLLAKYAEFRAERAALILRKDVRPEAWQALEDRKQKWTADFLGAERMARAEEGQKLAAAAASENNAARLVSRISSAADLSTAQKDRLYAAILERSRQTAPPSPAVPEKMEFRLYGDVTEEPSVPDLSQEAREILTPDQWEYFSQSGSLRARQNHALLQAMQSALPVLIPALQEVLDETSPGANPQAK